MSTSNSDTPSGRAMTYASAGVDINAGNELVRRIAPHAAATQRPETMAGVGGFAALSRLPSRYREPLLVTGTDGVGTKLKLAFSHDRHDTIGQDLVAMSVNDVIVTGAEPLLFLDYYATGRLEVDVAERVIIGIAKACELSGCALVGGETAEMPGMYLSGEYDLAGFCVGVVERSEVVTGEHLRPGDVLIGLSSSGPHSNGFSLIRRIIERQGASVGSALLDALMAPTRIYARTVAALQQALPVHGMAHITGGGLIENAPRMIPKHRRNELALRIDLDGWSRPEVFSWLQQAGNIDEEEMLRTFNCGIGFVVCVAAANVESALSVLRAAGERAQVIGHVVNREEADRTEGSLPASHRILRPVGKSAA